MCCARFAVSALLVLGALFAATVPCRSGDAITWAFVDDPPASHETDGRVAGIRADLVHALQRVMTEHGHKEAFMPMDRIMAEMKRGGHVCFAGMPKTRGGRSGLALSLPCFLEDPVVVATRANDSRVEGGAEVSLGRLASAGLKLGVAEGMDNGAVVDAIVFTMGRDRVVRIKGVDVAAEALKLLRDERIDFALVNLFDAAWTAGRMGMDREVAFHFIREDGSWRAGHVACPDTPWGRKVIARVNEILRADLSMDSFAAYGPYIPSDTLKEMAGAEYKALVLDEVRPER